MLKCRLVNREFNEIIRSSTLFQDFQSHLEEFNGLRVVGFDHVEGFCSSLSNLYKSVATSSIDRNRWKVTRISILRGTRFFAYESLVAQVVCGRVIVYLRIERKSHLRQAGNPSKATPKTQTSDHSTPSPDNATYSRDTTPPTAPGLSSSGRHLASDEITYSKVYTAVASYHEKCIEAIRFPEGKGLSLPQIAVLARCVNNFAPIYFIYGENHYWFAHVMIETAKLIETDFTLETMPKRKRRTLSGLLTPNKPISDVIKVKTMYDEQWAAFVQDIHDSINSYNSEIYQQALQRSLEEEERKKCAEVERLAAEKDRPIAEAQEEIKD
ncbi:hypothetical protein M378DRAFT_867265 [Amanita muscaria Koide BX008]|uniref:Uncharacterized protein n=1 Tax=Amanita muscaria (strain Koide BX008) TaxID=946122 RepID=A0A0C2SDN8_AMAMK|nr:hypothetical protein M378DRAFT_867265 [Amanita muscaria Koide BX008]